MINRHKLEPREQFKKLVIPPAESTPSITLKK